jgi:hypothetical protein
MTDSVIITCPDPAHKYHRGGDRDNKIKKVSNGSSVSNLMGQSLSRMQQMF